MLYKIFKRIDIWLISRVLIFKSICRSMFFDGKKISFLRLFVAPYILILYFKYKFFCAKKINSEFPSVDVKRLVRYAAKCCLLLHIHPSRNIPSSSITEVGTIFGSCIPTYDDIYDLSSELEAFAFSQEINKMILSENGFNYENSRNPVLIYLYTRLLDFMPSRDLLKNFKELFFKLNREQALSIGQRFDSLDEDSLRDISTRKGGASYLLLLSCVYQFNQELTNLFYNFGSWGQHMDDIVDCQNDLDNGIDTYANRVGSSKAKAFADTLLSSNLKFLSSTIPKTAYLKYSTMLLLGRGEKFAYVDLIEIYGWDIIKKNRHSLPINYWQY